MAAATIIMKGNRDGESCCRQFRDQKRENEAIERDYQQQLKMKNPEDNREINNERLKNVEITQIDHIEKLNENEKTLKTEYEEKIKRMQDDHDQEIEDLKDEDAKKKIEKRIDQQGKGSNKKKEKKYGIFHRIFHLVRGGQE